MPQDTRTLLIETAMTQVRRKGFSAFSYADLAEAVGIRKASIHHHFPGKEDLGVAIVAAYAEAFSTRLSEIDSRFPDAADRIAAFVGIYREALQSGLGCLCGVMASEFPNLPNAIRASVGQFFKLNLRWLEKTIGEGAHAGRLRHNLDPVQQARTVLATLQGALAVSRAMQDRKTFEQAASGLLAGMVA